MATPRSDFASHTPTQDYINVARTRIDAMQLSPEEKSVLHSEIDKASQFPFGDFMLQHHGLNGEWSHSILPWLFLSKLPTLPEGISMDPAPGEFVNDLQEFLYTQAPLVIATQQRFEIFVEEIQLYLQNNNDDIKIANFPCGWMSDLCLTLKLLPELASKVSITGIDLDEENEGHVQRLMSNLNITSPFSFVRADATKPLGSEESDAIPTAYQEQFDFIVAHGLSLYLEDEECLCYFKLLSAMLKPGGTLLTSTMTPPGEWRNVDAEQAKRQKDFFFTICNSSFSIFRSAEDATNMLIESGLEVTQVREDERNMFPTIVANKR